jgi:hypothetical protein
MEDQENNEQSKMPAMKQLLDESGNPIGTPYGAWVNADQEFLQREKDENDGGDFR